MQVGNFSNVSFCFLNQNNGFLKYPSSLNSSMQLLWLLGMLFYCSVAKLCLSLCDPIDCSTPGFPVLHCLLEFTQIHICSVILIHSWWLYTCISCFSMIVHNPMDFVYPIHISLLLTFQGTVSHQYQVWESSAAVTLKVYFYGWNVCVPTTSTC